MTDSTRLISIGELARTTDHSVRTIRFYCDEGILEARRSAGGHRMFEAEGAVERLRLVRRLRALGLGLGAIAGVLQEERSISETIAAERVRVDNEYRSLAWRRASLHALETVAPAERTKRLALLAAAQDGRAAYDSIVRFWRRILAPMTPDHFDGYIAMSVPEPPADPSAAQVAAYAEMTSLVTRPELYAVAWRQIWRPNPEPARDELGFLSGLATVCIDVLPVVSAGVQPHTGAALDRFVDAHAAARGQRDSPQFRQQLLVAATDMDRRILRYWNLTAELFETPATIGHAHHWLYNALNHSVRRSEIG
ncbi:MerR family transcriptional regulator [Nocardia uniformis]|uniref:MerR family transcriptional regulator n=1 Tax=Nocardia uniformis TaxID=53432 RepID=UPI000829A3AA|nr:MerR family transcriptional regulator [Nocardia uniformis]